MAHLQRADATKRNENQASDVLHDVFECFHRILNDNFLEWSIALVPALNDTCLD
jgi:hypothetical protein